MAYKGDPGDLIEVANKLLGTNGVEISLVHQIRGIEPSLAVAFATPQAGRSAVAQLLNCVAAGEELHRKCVRWEEDLRTFAKDIDAQDVTIVGEPTTGMLGHV